MRFALLGFNREAGELLRTIAESADHECIAVCDVGEGVETVFQFAPEAKQLDEWESLLLDTIADAVIVARNSTENNRDDQLRKLVQAAVPLLVVHPSCEAIVGYELDMIRRDTACRMVPMISGARHPAVSQAIERFGDDRPLGEIEQIVFERSMPDRSREAVLLRFACDIDVIAQFIQVQRVGAFGPSLHDDSFANLSVAMNGKEGELARWSVTPVDHSQSGVVTIVGSKGKLTIAMPDDGPWTMHEHTDEPASVFDHWNEYQQALDELTNQINTDGPVDSDWPSACRGLEIVANVETSLRRSRTIELFDEEHSEEQTFKGIMAIGGCALLLLGLLAMFGFAVVDGIMIPFRDAATTDDEPKQRFHLLIRMWPLYPFAAFLLLQLFRLVFVSPDTSESQET